MLVLSRARYKGSYNWLLLRFDKERRLRSENVMNMVFLCLFWNIKWSADNLILRVMLLIDSYMNTGWVVASRLRLIPIWVLLICVGNRRQNLIAKFWNQKVHILWADLLHIRLGLGPLLWQLFLHIEWDWGYPKHWTVLRIRLNC